MNFDLIGWSAVAAAFLAGGTVIFFIVKTVCEFAATL